MSEPDQLLDDDLAPKMKTRTHNNQVNGFADESNGDVEDAPMSPRTRRSSNRKKSKEQDDEITFKY